MSDKEQQHTPTPWRWQDFGRGLILISEASGKPIVMDFVRAGMNGAEPRFGKRTDSMGGRMVPLSKWETEPPDLEFIVRAVNSHLPLVTILRQMLNVFYPHSCLPGAVCARCETLVIAQKALSLAEKES